MSEYDAMVLDQDLRFIEEAIKGLHEPAGSPAYVRRLRDQAVSDRLARFGSGPLVKEDVREAVRYANYMVEALGYQVPEGGEVKS